MKFTTNDIELTAALVASGFDIEEVTPFSDVRADFSFATTPDLQKAVDMYYRFELMVVPQALFKARRTLKASVFQATTGSKYY